MERRPNGTEPKIYFGLKIALAGSTTRPPVRNQRYIKKRGEHFCSPLEIAF
jgi:hypothetical protein